MLNWRLEEREYVGKKIEEYYKSITALQRIDFHMSWQLK